MKKDKHILTTFIIVALTFLIGGYQTCQAQLFDGNYHYSNIKKNIMLEVSNAGGDINVIIELKNGKRTEGSGVWVPVNLQGVDEDYDGADGWYDIYVGDNNYVEIEVGFNSYNDRVKTYERIKVIIPNSDDTMLLHLIHYVEIE